MILPSLPTLAAAQQLASPRELAVWDRLINAGGDLGPVDEVDSYGV